MVRSWTIRSVPASQITEEPWISRECLASQFCRASCKVLSSSSHRCSAVGKDRQQLVGAFECNEPCVYAGNIRLRHPHNSDRHFRARSDDRGSPRCGLIPPLDFTHFRRTSSKTHSAHPPSASEAEDEITLRHKKTKK